MEARNLAAVGLSLMLAANCFMPCYTVAYANDLTYGGANYEQLREDQQERAGNGQVDQGADFQGVLRHEAFREAIQVPTTGRFKFVRDKIGKFRIPVLFQ